MPENKKVQELKKRRKEVEQGGGEKAIQKFNLTAIPLLLVIKRGKIVERLPGRRSDKFLEQKVKALINQ